MSKDEIELVLILDDLTEHQYTASQISMLATSFLNSEYNNPGISLEECVKQWYTNVGEEL